MVAVPPSPGAAAANSRVLLWGCAAKQDTLQWCRGLRGTSLPPVLHSVFLPDIAQGLLRCKHLAYKAQNLLGLRLFLLIYRA